MSSAILVTADKAFQGRLQKVLKDLGYDVAETYENCDACAVQVNTQPEISQVAYLVDERLLASDGKKNAMSYDALIGLVRSVTTRSCAVSVSPDRLSSLGEDLERAWAPVRQAAEEAAHAE